MYNSDEDAPIFNNRDEDDEMDNSMDETNEDVSSQEGDNLSRNDDDDEDQENSIQNDSDEDDNESMDEDTAMNTSRGKSLAMSYADSDNDESDNDDEREDDDRDDADDDDDNNIDESMYDETPSKDIGQENDDMDAEDTEQNEDALLEDDHSAIHGSATESSAVIATPLLEDSTEHAPGTGSSDVVAVAVESTTESSNQAEVVVAAVVPKRKRKTPTSNKKKAVSPKKSKSPKKKGTGGRRKRSDSDLSTSSNAISRDRLEAAQQARDILIKTVNQTPFTISESHVVQNFGRIKVEDSEHPLFSTPTSLYPVGFACDRYEFSPVHGRILKMRCEILDGSKFKEGLNTEPGNEGNKTIPKKHEGPLFRISWGQGIDELEEVRPFPFEVYSSCTPMMNEVDTVAVPLGFHSNSTKPEKGMRVKVRIDKYSWYRGTIMSVKNTDDEKEDDDSSKRKSSKKKKQSYNIKIVYDDGLTEYTNFPDPDVSLVAPGK
jgi:hypothetical protein